MTWTVPDPQPPKQPCPRCGVHTGRHATEWHDGQPGRHCLDCGTTWPIRLETLEIEQPQNGDQP